jgi:ABC-type sugar transport system ATPase subunit
VSSIRFNGIGKQFPGVTALHEVSFDVASGSCHAICGENGAGKSTLGKILAGIERPDSGTIELNGRAMRFGSPRDAMTSGIAMVHQELAFCPNLSVAENLCLSRLPRRRGFVDRRELKARATELLSAVGADFETSREMASLSVAEQQLVQIAAAVGANASVIVFDEPTSSLGQREADRLYDVITSLRGHGTTVIYVSHRMPEIFRLCDHVTVLRDGALVESRAVDGLSESALVELMIGRKLEESSPSPGAIGDPALEVRELHVPGHVHDVSFTLHRGEVLGLAGLVGAGRSDVAQAIFGLESRSSGSIRVRGRDAEINSPRDAMAHGIGLVPEDRKKLGLVLSMLNRENCSLPVLSGLATAGWVDRNRERRLVSDAFVRVQIEASQDVATQTLSGGNQQKVVLAKWLAAQSEVLILDEPTRGVDVGAKAELHAWINRHAAEGGAVLLISSDMPELLSLSTRLLVLREGRLVGEVSRATATQDTVLRLMSGLQVSPSEASP